MSCYKRFSIVLRIESFSNAISDRQMILPRLPKPADNIPTLDRYGLPPNHPSPHLVISHDILRDPTLGSESDSTRPADLQQLLGLSSAKAAYDSLPFKRFAIVTNLAHRSHIAPAC
jgi:hypothetical protein